MSVSDSLGYVGISLMFVVVVLDKAGKVRGTTSLVFLGIAAAMIIPPALSNSWISNATPWMAKFARSALAISIVALVYSGFAVWVSTPSPATPFVAAKKPCHSENGQLMDCTDSEVVKWGKPLLVRLNKAIRENEAAVVRRHQRYEKDHDKKALNNKRLENDRLNRYLEKDYPNFLTYRTALISHLEGGNPSGSDPLNVLLTESVDHGRSGELVLSNEHSVFLTAMLVLRDLQDLSERLARQAPMGGP